MKLLEKKRDELALSFFRETKVYPDMCPRDDFYAGFDAAFKELEPIIASLISDMQYMAADDVDIADVPSEVRSYILRARAAIKKYKNQTGEL